jgi:hypothetical protein
MKNNKIENEIENEIEMNSKDIEEDCGTLDTWMQEMHDHKELIEDFNIEIDDLMKTIQHSTYWLIDMQKTQRYLQREFLKKWANLSQVLVKEIEKLGE